MACLLLSVTSLQSVALAAEVMSEPRLTTAAAEPPSLAVSTADTAKMTILAQAQAAVGVTSLQQATLTVGEVCSVSGGTITVLAAADGPLRTRDGGYFLLNPEANPSEN